MRSIRLITTGIMSALLIMFSFSVAASGGYSNSSSGSGYASAPAKQVDQAYESGKSIFFGRVKGERITYCISGNSIGSGNSAGNQPIVVKRSTMKQLKGLEYSEVAVRLYNCKNPAENMTSLLTKSQVNSVMYYLNKRYRLNLVRG